MLAPVPAVKTQLPECANGVHTPAGLPDRAGSVRGEERIRAKGEEMRRKPRGQREQTPVESAPQSGVHV